MKVDRREAIGYVVMAMLVFSLVASVIPVEPKTKIRLGPTWFPLEKGVEFVEELDPQDVSFKLQAGELKVINSDVERPLARISGFKTDEGVAVGEVLLELPKGWSGRLNLSVKMGELKLSGAEVGELMASIVMGSIDGTVKVTRALTVKGTANEVDLTIIVPENVKVVLEVDARRSSILVDGKSYEGASQRLTSGEGTELPLKVKAGRVKLVVIRG